MPGTKDEKMRNWMQPIFDNLAYMSNAAEVVAAHAVRTKNPYGALMDDEDAIESPQMLPKSGRRRRRQHQDSGGEPKATPSPNRVQRMYRNLGYGDGYADGLAKEGASEEQGQHHEEESTHMAAGVTSAFIARRKTQEQIQEKVQMEAITFLRGRSIVGEFVIVDEAQNLTPHEIKTIVSRAGEGTKIVLCGDPLQIDNP
jgi:hypothetical protein